MNKGRWDDHYTRRAKEEKWLARSVYKLQEIDRKFRLIHKGDRVLDLGCYPGSWSQYGLKKTGPGGDVFGVDLLLPAKISTSNFRYLKCDVLEMEIETLRLQTGSRDIVMSDLGPKTTGIKSADAARSVALAQRALLIAKALLRPDGRFVCKVYEGEDFGSFKADAHACFKRTSVLRPKATRKGSRELYLIGLGYH